MTPRQLEILREFELRSKVRGSMIEWSRVCGFEPQTHHRLLIKKLEHAEKHGEARLIVCMPPGSAKSTYISRLFPSWFLARQPNRSILATSYSKDLIVGHARVARNYVDTYGSTLEMSLKSDTKAADEWETSTGGRFFCAGVNAGIAGHRANLAFIDDPIGSDEDAKSQNFRDKQWSWFWDDLIPRLQPRGSVIIIANRRHEDDLVGRLLATDGDRWEHVKIPLIVESEAQRVADPLGRAIGERLWPEYYTDLKMAEARKSENFSGLYQQDPSPEEGDLIKRDCLLEYHSREALPRELRVYVGSDHALTTKEENDSNCLLPAGVDSAGDLWVLPEVYWDQCDTAELVSRMIGFGRQFSICQWWAENEHIHKAIGPFLNQRMMKEKVFLPITGLTSSKDLVARSSSIRGFLRLKKVHFPAFMPWWHLAKHQLLSFPKGKHDDFVAALSELGQGLASMSSPSAPASDPFDASPKPPRLTIRWLREQEALRHPQPRYADR